MDKLISIVVPVYNSSKFLHKTIEAIDNEKRKSKWNLELVLVDDGSTDNSFSRIQELSTNYDYIKGIKLSRNFGHQAAVRTGLTFCKGNYVAIIDDDLQDPPSLLPRFFAYLDDGYDVAFGERKKRKESLGKKLAYRYFYRLLRRLSSIEIPLDSGDFCVMKKKVVESILALPERNPFLRGMRAWVGFKQIAVTYERDARVDGQSGYTFAKLVKIGADGIFSFSKIPIRIITFIGIVGLAVAVSVSVLLVALYLTGNIEVRGFTTLALLISFFGSINLICLGVIGEYIARIYDETLDRPHSIVERTWNL
jgi:dolichol-phosphate mannosyltransferase